jgi:hypothetical protein
VMYLSIFFLLVFGLAVKPRITATALQQASLPSEERKIEVINSRALAASVPIAITAIRNLQGQDWLKEVEIEIQNTSNKPIYYLEIATFFPDLPKFAGVDGSERRVMMTLYYGRIELAHLSQRPDSTDVPIQPLEKYVFKIPEPKRQGLEAILSRQNLTPAAIRNINFKIYMVNFGDGTGVRVGSPYPGRQSSLLHVADSH